MTSRSDKTTCRDRSNHNLDSATHRAWEQFRAFLKARRARITEARRIVLRRVLERGDHFLADDLAADLNHGPARVSRGTVYRTLALLVEGGFVRQVRDADVHMHYESIFERPRHYHLVCDRCRRFIEFNDKGIADSVQAYCDQHGFAQRTHHVMVLGVCDQCAGEQDM